MSNQKPQSLPDAAKEKGQSMDDILAQIRRIVSDEAAAAKPAQEPAPSSRAPNAAFGNPVQEPAQATVAEEPADAQKQSLRDRLGFGERRPTPVGPATQTPADKEATHLGPDTSLRGDAPSAVAAPSQAAAPSASVFARANVPRPVPESETGSSPAQGVRPATDLLAARRLPARPTEAEEAPVTHGVAPTQPTQSENATLEVDYREPSPTVEPVEPRPVQSLFGERTHSAAPVQQPAPQMVADVEPVPAPEPAVAQQPAPATSPLERLRSSMTLGQPDASVQDEGVVEQPVVQPVEPSPVEVDATANAELAQQPNEADDLVAAVEPTSEASTAPPVVATAKPASLEELVADAIGGQVKSWMETNMERIVREVIAEDLASRKTRS